MSRLTVKAEAMSTSDSDAPYEDAFDFGSFAPSPVPQFCDFEASFDDGSTTAKDHPAAGPQGLALSRGLPHISCAARVIASSRSKGTKGRRAPAAAEQAVQRISAPKTFKGKQARNANATKAKPENLLTKDDANKKTASSGKSIATMASKRPVNAFLLWCSEIRRKMHQKQKLCNREASVLLGREWAELPESVKDRYRLQAKKEFDERRVHMHGSCYPAISIAGAQTESPTSALAVAASPLRTEATKAATQRTRRVRRTTAKALPAQLTAQCEQEVPLLRQSSIKAEAEETQEETLMGGLVNVLEGTDISASALGLLTAGKSEEGAFDDPGCALEEALSTIGMTSCLSTSSSPSFPDDFSASSPSDMSDFGSTVPSVSHCDMLADEDFLLIYSDVQQCTKGGSGFDEQENSYISSLGDLRWCDMIDFSIDSKPTTQLL